MAKKEAPVNQGPSCYSHYNTPRTTTIPCLRCGRTGRCYVDANGNSCYCYHPNDGRWGYASKIGKDGGQLFWADPPGKPTAKPTSAPISKPTASKDEWHKVYNRQLELCPLESSDIHHLKCVRGITDPKRYRFGRMPSLALSRSGIAYRLSREFGEELLLRVPGFISHKGKIKLNPGRGGLLIPSSSELITNIRLRLDEPVEGARYRYLSGGTRGAKAVPTAYAVRPEGGEGRGSALGILTEGEFKAISCHQAFGCLSVGVPGVGLWQLGLEQLAGMSAVLVAWDADHKSNPNVLRTLKQCVSELIRRNQQPLLPLWSSPHKGFDDVLLAGADYELISGNDLTAYLAKTSTEVQQWKQ